MKILFTGGGTGGHFYPIIAVGQEIREIARNKKLVEPQFFYMADNPYNEKILFENKIKFIPVTAGKIRRYFSLKNLLTPFYIASGLLTAIIRMYQIYPDVIFSKGGYASVPALFAGRILRIPIVIHESDSHPGRANLWSAKFARRVALAYPEALKYFPSVKSAVVGNPLRRDILKPINAGAFEFLKLDPNIPVIFVVGGSQGATKINEVILDILPQLLEKYQIIHQTGKNNFDDVSLRASFLLKDNPLEKRYKPFAYLNDLAMKMAGGATQLIVSRAGSAIFEFALWGIPSIIIPIPEDVSHDQRTNAFTYARAGACVVIEENNLTPSILKAEIDRLMANPDDRQKMSQAAKAFARPEAATLIAEEIIKIGLEHEE